MKIQVIVAFVFLAGCAQHSALHLNDGRWGEFNEEVQRKCVLKIIEIAPPDATAQALDYNLQRCMMVNGIFI